jgi:hypothetical protein
LVINWKTLVGRQVVLKDSHYETKHFIFSQVPASAAVPNVSTAPTQCLDAAVEQKAADVSASAES